MVLTRRFRLSLHVAILVGVKEAVIIESSSRHKAARFPSISINVQLFQRLKCLIPFPQFPLLFPFELQANRDICQEGGCLKSSSRGGQADSRGHLCC